MQAVLLVSFILMGVVTLTSSRIIRPRHATDFMNFKSDPKLSLGSAACAVCTVLTGLVDQLSVVHQETHNQAFDRLCDFFPSPFSGFCGAFDLFYGGRIKRLLSEGQTPDVVCVGVGMCNEPTEGREMCHLFPLQKNLQQKDSKQIKSYIAGLMADSYNGTRVDPRVDVCSIPLIGTIICNFLNVHAFTIEYPREDDDNDGFSEDFTLRGSAWRGKDCQDGSASSYPGRRPANNDLIDDSNCNGIFGQGVSGSLEEELCAGSDAKGVIALGDSVTANFHVPGIWFDSTQANAGLYSDLENLMDNSFNWPHTSLYTGYQNLDHSPILEGETDSIYLRMRERNLCNHRDYQNIGFNGAKTTEAAAYAQTVKRSPQDKPAIAFFSYLGNDVCKYHPDPALDETTTPAQARAGLLATMAALNSKLPPGSHAVVVGVPDARPFFDSLRTKIHPFGALRQDVTYLNFYSWLDCMDLQPCRGWLTADENIRAITAQRVLDINAELQNVVLESQSAFPNVKMVYLPSPVDEVVGGHMANGGESWELVELFDGFHPNQRAHKLIAEAVWNRLERDHPDIIGPINPNNDLIRQLFDDQGGH